MRQQNLLMRKLKRLEHSLKESGIYNSSCLDSQIFMLNFKIPQLLDLIRKL
jgi:hypothetical protein